MHFSFLSNQSNHHRYCSCFCNMTAACHFSLALLPPPLQPPTPISLVYCARHLLAADIATNTYRYC
jgi:hypothetical protein